MCKCSLLCVQMHTGTQGIVQQGFCFDFSKYSTWPPSQTCSTKPGNVQQLQAEFPAGGTRTCKSICALLSILLKVHIPFCISFLGVGFLPLFLVGLTCIWLILLHCKFKEQFICTPGNVFGLRCKKHRGPEKSVMNLPPGSTWKAVNTTEVIKKQIKRGHGGTQSGLIWRQETCVLK